MADLPEHVATNRAFWDELADNYVDSGRRNWESEEPRWGIFSVPESEVGLLPAAIEGRDSIELGCGTGYVSAWLARRGARPVGIGPDDGMIPPVTGSCARSSACTGSSGPARTRSNSTCRRAR